MMNTTETVLIKEATNGYIVEHTSNTEYDMFVSEFVALDIDEALAIARDVLMHYSASDMSHLADTPIGR